MIYYRKLLRADAPRIEAHFLALSPEDRRRRFHSPLGDDAVRAYCRSFNWSERAVIGAFDLDRLVGIAECVRVAADSAEIAVSVDSRWQHHGVGRELVRRAAASAANSGAVRAVLDYAPGETSIPHIARSLGGEVDALRGVAQIALPTRDAAGQIEELIEDLGAALAGALEAALWPLRFAAGTV
ncbi:MAG TPA: GNAT family N-acetyltransferase [Stellaceae bacterium]